MGCITLAQLELGSTLFILVSGSLSVSSVTADRFGKAEPPDCATQEVSHGLAERPELCGVDAVSGFTSR